MRYMNRDILSSDVDDRCPSETRKTSEELKNLILQVVVYNNSKSTLVIVNAPSVE